MLSELGVIDDNPHKTLNNHHCGFVKVFDFCPIKTASFFLKKYVFEKQNYKKRERGRGRHIENLPFLVHFPVGYNGQSWSEARN